MANRNLNLDTTQTWYISVDMKMIFNLNKSLDHCSEKL